jgi:hypothetical protein
VFSPNFGEATAHTLSPKDYTAARPNVAGFFPELVLDLKHENLCIQKVIGWDEGQ